MKDELKSTLEHIVKYQEYFVKRVLNDIWDENPDDWSVEILTYSMVELSDMYFSFNDFITFAKYEIPKNIVWEWYDHISLSHTTERVKDYLLSIKDKDFEGTYLDFYRFTNK